MRLEDFLDANFFREAIAFHETGGVLRRSSWIDGGAQSSAYDAFSNYG